MMRWILKGFNTAWWIGVFAIAYYKKELTIWTVLLGIGWIMEVLLLC